ncbi:MAG: putative glycoside hydrolase [Planctomycetota bacterium]|jgi:hypothetical protein
MRVFFVNVKSVFLLMILVTAGCSSQRKTSLDLYPEFSWDTVPLYFHLGKSTAYTDTEIEFIAEFDFIALEKGTASRTHGSTEKGILAEAKRIKKINPKTKILFYWNVFMDYGRYDAHKVFKQHPDWSLKDLDGNEFLVREHIKTYDFTNPQMRDWWTDVCKEATSNEYIDGIFVDASFKVFFYNDIRNKIGAKKHDKLMAGYIAMMKQTREKIGPDKIMLPNLVRAKFSDSGLGKIKYFSGSYLERVTVPMDMSYEEYLAKGMAAVQKAARQGYIIAMRVEPTLIPPFRTNEEFEELPKDQREKFLRDNITYPLAVFLIVAEKYSYFNYSIGYGAEQAIWHQHYGEFEKPLGKPKGHAKKQGWTYTRSFEHADVWLDIKNKKAKIDWH